MINSEIPKSRFPRIKKSWKEILPRQIVDYIILTTYGIREIIADQKKRLNPFKDYSTVLPDWHKFYENPACLNEQIIEILLKPENRESQVSAQKALEEFVKANELEFYSFARYNLNLLLCLNNYKSNIQLLYRKAKNLDKDALIKLVSIDPSLLGTDFAKRILQQADLAQDRPFFKKLTYSINSINKNNKVFSKDKHMPAKYAAYLLDSCGKDNIKYKLTRDQITIFLYDNKLTEINMDPNDLRKEIVKFTKSLKGTGEK